MQFETSAASAALAHKQIERPGLFEQDTVFERTDQGLAEIRKRSHTLTQSERQVLIWIASSHCRRAKYSELIKMSTALTQTRIEKALRKLLDCYFIVEVLMDIDHFGVPAISQECLTGEDIAAYLESEELDPNSVIMTEDQMEAMEQFFARVKKPTMALSAPSKPRVVAVRQMMPPTPTKFAIAAAGLPPATQAQLLSAELNQTHKRLELVPRGAVPQSEFPPGRRPQQMRCNSNKSERPTILVLILLVALSILLFTRS